MDGSILIENGVGEVRAVAVGADQRPFSLFVSRSNFGDHFAKWGQTYPAILKKIAPDQGGGFADISSGETVFLRAKELRQLAEGARVNVKIEAEARRSKFARASVVEQLYEHQDPFSVWKGRLPGANVFKEEQVPPGASVIDEAFEEALSPFVTLPGGGLLRLSETPALIAIDIDTAGRRDAGRSYDRAHTVNLVAAKEAARQISLRGLGGLMVLGCVAPLRNDKKGEIKSAFLETFRQYSSQKVDAINPSRFGLLEAAIAWRHRPVAHRLLQDQGGETHMTVYMALVRDLERELVSDPAGSYGLSLTHALESIHNQFSVQMSQALSARYGSQFSIEISPNDKSKVTRQ